MTDNVVLEVAKQPPRTCEQFAQDYVQAFKQQSCRMLAGDARYQTSCIGFVEWKDCVLFCEKG